MRDFLEVVQSFLYNPDPSYRYFLIGLLILSTLVYLVIGAWKRLVWGPEHDKTFEWYVAGWPLCFFFVSIFVLLWISSQSKGYGEEKKA